MIVGFKKIVLVHLALKGFSVDELRDFELGMTSASAIDELYRIETWASRVDIMGGLKELGIFPDEWIIRHFTDLTEDELDLIKREMELKQAQGGGAEEEEGDGEDFFEDRKISGLIKEQKENELRDLIHVVQEKRRKESCYASVEKFLNDNELDGLKCRGEKIESDIENREKIIKEVKEILTLSIDEELDLESQDSGEVLVG